MKYSYDTEMKLNKLSESEKNKIKQFLKEAECYDINQNRIVEISIFMSKILDIKIIDINNIDKIPDVLKYFTNLEILNLSHNNITKIENLEKLKNLKELYLGHNEITKIEGLGKLKRLKFLYLEHNLITKINGLEKLKLQELNLDNNLIKKIENINFFDVKLNNNDIKIIENIEKFSELKYLSLKNNPLKESIYHFGQIQDYKKYIILSDEQNNKNSINEKIINNLHDNYLKKEVKEFKKSSMEKQNKEEVISFGF